MRFPRPGTPLATRRTAGRRPVARDLWTPATDVGAALYGAAVTVRLPSVGLVLDALQAELDRRRQHFESLDTKSGLILGFSGVLLSLPKDVPFGFLAAGSVLVAAAAVASLLALWPRGFPVLNTTRLADYIAAEIEFTQRRMTDTVEQMLVDASHLLRRKALALKVAFVLLSAGLLVLGMGGVWMAADK